MSQLEALEVQLIDAATLMERVDVLNCLAEHLVRSDMRRSLDCAEQACTEARQGEYLLGEARGYRNRAVCRLIQADLERAEEDYRHALRLSQEIPARDVEAACLLGLSTLQRKATRYSEAIELLMEAGQLHREEKDILGEISVLNNLGALSIELGNYTEAMGFLTEGLALAREHAYPEYEIFCITNTAGIRRNSGDIDGALMEYQQALELALKLDNHYVRPHILAAMCEAYLKQGEVEQALRVNEEALLLASVGEDHQIELTLLIHLGNICDELGMPEAAEAAFIRVLERTEFLGDQERHLEALCQAGAYYQRQGRVDEARACFSQVRQQAALVKAQRHLARACRALSALERDVVVANEYSREAVRIEELLQSQAEESQRVALRRQGGVL